MRVLAASFVVFLSVVDFVPTGTVAQTLCKKSNPGPCLKRKHDSNTTGKSLWNPGKHEINNDALILAGLVSTPPPLASGGTAMFVLSVKSVNELFNRQTDANGCDAVSQETPTPPAGMQMIIPISCRISSTHTHTHAVLSEPHYSQEDLEIVHFYQDTGTHMNADGSKTKPT